MIGFVVAGAILLAANGRPSVITNPDWAAPPDADAVAEAYPSVASDLRIEGYGTISCQITLEGRAEACKVIGESPLEWGFGDAAIQAAKSFRFKPKTLDGAPVAGGTVRIPLHFKMPLDTGAARAAAYKPPRVTAARLALAWKVVALRGDKASLLLGLRGIMVEALAKSPLPPGASPAFRSDLETAFQEAGDALFPVVLDTIAKEYAAEHSETQMNSVLAMAKRADGLEKAIKASPLKVEGALESQEARFVAMVRTSMCAKHNCNAQRPVILPLPAIP